MFTLNEDNLRKMWKKCSFSIAEDPIIFFGLRGCLPVDLDNNGFASEHALVTHSYNHKNMRCTLGQWKPGLGIAVFPGSTVPTERYIRGSKARGGKGTNMLLRGLYLYEKGKHHSGKPRGHRAFRQATWFPVRRTSDDLDYDNADPVDFDSGIVWDNLHCAWNLDPSNEGFASAGCQVVAGLPSCPHRGNAPDIGPWAAFVRQAYAIEQKNFSYGLFSGLEMASIAGGANPACNLRFNSRGPLVEELQQLLSQRGYDTNGTDGHFGRNTLEALLNFQTQEIGPNADDGIVGPGTAAVLGLRLPNLDDSIYVPGVAILVPEDPDVSPTDDDDSPEPAPIPDAPDGVEDLPQTAIEMIKYFEASGDVTRFLRAYQDSVGVWTIGYGHTGLVHRDGTVRAGRVITAEQAEELLKFDLKKFTEAVDDLITVDLTPEQYGALVSFSFNVGAGALKGSTLRRLLNAGNYEGAANEFQRWCKAGGRRLLGLYRRRIAEQRLFNGKNWTKAKDIQMPD